MVVIGYFVTETGKVYVVGTVAVMNFTLLLLTLWNWLSRRNFEESETLARKDLDSTSISS